ncbi:SusC/RagA family TonB-linked outer membrane protein [Flavobacterium sp. xlx-214]|nr:SusC/RagA family TonB-linked outer membrane protein [Flavobacterium sp. xlx-221]QMI84972.1 SusC/RagA family TonB-linked outer membrane protein [Flavobacterium sp. xlx-214]
MWVLLLVLLLLSNNKLYAQERTVLSGVVKSVNGTPLEGVTVWQPETNEGTQTNAQGFYSLEITPNTTVTFEYLGYVTQKVKASSKVLNVTLTEDNDVLDEVVINAGYYSVKDKERTGSISKITSKEIGQQPVANPLAAMQGRMAGVNITQSSGTPGGGFDIQIRGRNSLRTEGNAPLYIVDGVPYSSDSASDRNLTLTILPGGNVSPLNSINPNDIESIEVLKDADATAIYGSRGSNGVVLITTKKGTSDKTTFAVQSTTSVSTVAKFMDLMNTEQYLQVRHDAFKNDGITEYPKNAYDVNGTWDQNRYTNWQKEFIGGKAVSQNTQFSVGGGFGKTNYLFSASHRKDGTVFPGDFGYKRTSFLLNASHQSKDERFKFFVSAQKSDQKNKLMATDLTSKIFLAPNAPSLYTSSGEINWENNTFENPIAALQSKYISEINNTLFNVIFNYDITKSLSVQLKSGTTYFDTDETKTIPHTIFNPSLKRTSENSSTLKTINSRNSWIVEPIISWKKELKNSTFDILIGGTLEQRQQNIFGIEASNFTSDSFINNIASGAVQKILFDKENVYKYAAFYGRLNYNLNRKYILNITGRRDGSSRFGPNNRFGNFGAIGGAWLFSREKLFDNNSWLSFGKIRASYGIAGSDLIGDYQFLNTYGISRLKYDDHIGLEPIRLYNPDFSWETNKKIEGALELEFFNGRIATSVSYFRNRSSNQLVGIPLPSTTGFNSVQANLNATVENSGMEITFNSVNILKKKFKWTTSVNMSFPKNKLISFPNLEDSSYATQYEIGQPTTIRKMYGYKGIDKETGLYIFEDVNGDGIINLEDRKSVVNTGVKFFGGIHNQITYKRWSLDFMIQYVQQQGFSPDYYSTYLGSMNNRSNNELNYYSMENKEGYYQIPTAGNNTKALQSFQNFRNSDAVVTDASFLRLKSLQIVYNVPTSFIKNTNCSMFFQGYNLITLTKYWGADPETIGTFLPALRTLSFGFNINF